MSKLRIRLTGLLSVLLIFPIIVLGEFAEHPSLGLAIELPKGWRGPDTVQEDFFFATGRHQDDVLGLQKCADPPLVWDQDGLTARYHQEPGFALVSYHASETGAERPWMAFKYVSQTRNGNKLWSARYYYTLADDAVVRGFLTLAAEPDEAMLSWIAALEENLLGEALDEE